MVDRQKTYCRIQGGFDYSLAAAYEHIPYTRDYQQT